MAFWKQSGRRGRRSAERLFGRILSSGYGAAEGVLGAVAAILVVWLLWPEDHGPQIDQRSAWEQSVDEAERRRIAVEATRRARELDQAAKTKQEALSTAGSKAVSDEPTRLSQLSLDSDRRWIARPSDLADPLDRRGLRPGQPLADRSFAPAPERPYESGDAAGDDSGRGDQELTVAVLSTEALDAAPLPHVDLSDLDTLVPLEPKVEHEAETPDHAVSQQAALPPPAEAPIEPLLAEPDSAVPTTDVSKRPRDDAPTWLKNAVTAAEPDQRPMIAIVIDDLGLNRPNTAELNSLKAPLTLAFLPYAGRIEAQTEAAHAAGHELMLHMPMEPFGSDWPGPDALTTKIDREEFTARLTKNLDRFEGFVGVNNHMGSKLTSDPSRMDVVMRELRKRDVLFLDSKTSGRTVAGKMAGLNGVPNTTRDIFLDHVIDLDSIRRQLARTEKIASRYGSAVAIGHPHSATIQALREWLPGLEERGFMLAPISAVVARRACSHGVLIADETCGHYLQVSSPATPKLVAKDG
ncbi:MAG: divergent polysaccharide deacetylase family protein [Alphaproteobacteria bacterium]